jgi:catechol 2,3-dioxygenase-like lactoylglutathione lyase family enzyme
MTQFISSNVTVMISNMDKSVAFYTEILGLKLKNRYGEHWAEVEGPGITIGLHPSKKINTGDNLSIAFSVKNLDKAISELEQKGVKFNIYKDNKVNLAFFTDPDGNTLYLAPAHWQ